MKKLLAAVLAAVLLAGAGFALWRHSRAQAADAPLEVPEYVAPSALVYETIGADSGYPMQMAQNEVGLYLVLPEGSGLQWQTGHENSRFVVSTPENGSQGLTFTVTALGYEVLANAYSAACQSDPDGDEAQQLRQQMENFYTSQADTLTVSSAGAGLCYVFTLAMDENQAITLQQWATQPYKGGAPAAGASALVYDEATGQARLTADMSYQPPQPETEINAEQPASEETP